MTLKLTWNCHSNLVIVITFYALPTTIKWLLASFIIFSLVTHRDAIFREFQDLFFTSRSSGADLGRLMFWPVLNPQNFREVPIFHSFPGSFRFDTYWVALKDSDEGVIFSQFNVTYDYWLSGPLLPSLLLKMYKSHK